MKQASILLIAVALCGFSFAACAEGDDTTFGNRPSGGTGGEGGGKGASSSSSSSSASSSTGISSGGVCTVQCASNADCTNNCPTPPKGINCCDVGTNTCYVSQSMTCPGSGTGAGSSGGMYP